jgi:hypothetical protein
MMRWLASNFQHTTNSEQKVASENDLKAVENGGAAGFEPPAPVV